uniref:Dilute domain-containing protein n=1 Tax=Chenopodium quinoa TaxID=63459 RepID=A0A803ND26_CHEQI
MFKVRSAFCQHQKSIVVVQSLWRRKMARHMLRRLKQEANEAGALRKAKTKLEKQLEDLTLRLHLEKRLRVSVEEAKVAEITKQQRVIEALNLELEEAKSQTVKQGSKNAQRQSDLEFSMKEKYELQKQLQDMERFQEGKCNFAVWRTRCQIWRMKILCCGKSTEHVPKRNRPGFVKSFSDMYSSALSLPYQEKKPIYETPTPTKHISITPGLSESRWSKQTVEKHQENYEFLSKCIKENMGFQDNKPVAACVIYKCLLHWHAFESERTAIFDHIIEGINNALKCLRSNSFLNSASNRAAGSAGYEDSLKLIGFDDGVSHIEARYPAILFKQQLTASVEKIFGLIRDNLKKEISPLLGVCIHAPKTARGGKSSRSPGGVPQQLTSNQWDSIIQFLDSLMSHLHKNHVPSFFIRKLITQVFSFININLFNSLLLRRECCTFSNGEYVKSGLAELEKWIACVTDEFAGTAWHELNYIRQAVGFLVIHQKRKKSLEEIKQDLCPALTVRQIYRISTMYWDDKYGTQSVSMRLAAFLVVAQMREMLNKDNQNLATNSFLLDDDLSIPFSTEDISKAIPATDPMDVKIPACLSNVPAAKFLLDGTTETCLTPLAAA